MTKKDKLRRELARRLSTRLNRLVRATEIWDRRQTAEAVGFSENHFTNGLTDDLPNHYFADETQFGPSGLMLFLKADVERRRLWRNERFEWPPESDEPSTADMVKFLGG